MVIIPRRNLNLNITKQQGNIICNFCSLKQRTKLIINGDTASKKIISDASPHLLQHMLTKMYVNGRLHANEIGSR